MRNQFYNERPKTILESSVKNKITQNSRSKFFKEFKMKEAEFVDPSNTVKNRETLYRLIIR